MNKNNKPSEAAAAQFRVVRLFEGKRTAEQVVADLVKVHTAA